MSRAGSGGVTLPRWAVAMPRRRAHIIRVTKLLMRWADALELDARTRAAWRDAGAWHDALRDANPEQLGPPAVDPTLPPGAWHGPAAAKRLRREGERRRGVLEAITWHTVGHASWGPTGRALFCADFLEPGRRSEKRKRRDLAARFPDDPEGVLRKVVRMRLERAGRDGADVHPRMAALWEAVR